MKVIPLHAFEDNYIWLIRHGHACAVVDPGDADPVLAYLEQEGLALAAILVTHHHGDHVAGLPELARFHAPVYGPATEPIPGVSHLASDGETLRIPDIDLEFAVLGVPGHTRGHVAYYGRGMVFCGDTLFACGCGRLFEGTAAQMHDSLSRLGSLPSETEVYCAHEYTESNIRFSLKVEPGNAALQDRARQARRARAVGQPTLPSSIGLELATNPFLRCGQDEVREHVEHNAGRSLSDEGAVFAALREWKNRG